MSELRWPLVGEVWRSVDGTYTIEQRTGTPDRFTVKMRDGRGAGLCSEWWWTGDAESWPQIFEMVHRVVSPPVSQMPALPGWTCERGVSDAAWVYMPKYGSTYHIIVRDVDVEKHGAVLAVAREAMSALSHAMQKMERAETIEVGTVNDNPRRQRERFLETVNDAKRKQCETSGESRITHIPEAKRNQVACQGDWLDTWEGEDA